MQVTLKPLSIALILTGTASLATATRQEAPNVRFLRPLAGSSNSIQGESTVSAEAVGLPMPDFDSDTVAGSGRSFVTLPGLQVDAAVAGADSEAQTTPFLGKIFPAPGAEDWAPDHEWVVGHLGLCRLEQAGPWTNAGATTRGYLSTRYATLPGNKVPASLVNTNATLYCFLDFVGVGPPEHLVMSNLTMDPDTPASGQYSGDESFRHRIVIGASDVQVTYLGEGVFVSSGELSRSSESAPLALPENVFQIDEGGFNKHFSGTQIIPIRSAPQTAVDVEVLQISSTGASRITVGGSSGDEYAEIGVDTWVWSFTTNGWFYGKDLDANN